VASSTPLSIDPLSGSRAIAGPAWRVGLRMTVQAERHRMGADTLARGAAGGVAETLSKAVFAVPERFFEGINALGSMFYSGR
jgi:hypothetical protein